MDEPSSSQSQSSQPQDSQPQGSQSQQTSITSAERKAAWIQACRPRTLPLAAAGSVIAAALAFDFGVFRWAIFILMLITSIQLQIIANFADDYGDLKSGLDDDSRVGPKRGMQRGIITFAQMKRALIVLSCDTFTIGLILVIVSFMGGPDLDGGALATIIAFVALGIVCIAAAMLYTMGKHPYGYMGLGDIVSFFFFGIVAVVGGTFLYVHAFTWVSLVAAIGLGLPTAAVMNVNNMRDSAADKAKGKRTIANLLGDPAMRVYETVLLACAAVCFLASAAMCGVTHPLAYIALVISFVPWIRMLATMWKTPDPQHFDRLMKPTSMGSVIVAIVFAAVVVIAG